jgi:hypothetical protein
MNSVKKKIRIWGVLFGVFTLALTACSSKPPQCNDESTLALVKKIYMNLLTERVVALGEKPTLLAKMKSNVKLSINTILATANDEKIGKIICRASLVADLPEFAKFALENAEFRKALSRDALTNDLNIKGLSVSADIRYTAQMTVDKNEQLVELAGHQGIVELVAALGTMRIFDDAIEAKPVPSKSSEIVQPALPASKRTLLQITLQSFECGDICHLNYKDEVGAPQSAVCVDAEQCRAWAEKLETFNQWSGTKADLVLGKKYMAQGGVTLDNVLEITLAATLAKPISSAPAAPTAPTPVAATTPMKIAVPNLCSANETVLFACSTGKKQVSLCATKELSAKSGQITYRLAPTAQAPEMTYPDGDPPPKAAYKYGAMQFSGDRAASFISFDKGNFRYVIYGAEGKDLYKHGVAVEQSGKRIASLACRGDVAHDWDSKVLEEIGVEKDARGFDLP